MQCYVCDGRVRPRGFRRIENIEGGPEFQEAALARRVNNNLPERNFLANDVIHTNCYRQVTDGLDVDNDDENRCRLNCVVQRRNMCFVCNQQGLLNHITLEARVKVFIDKEIFIPKSAICCLDHYEDNTRVLRQEHVDGLIGNIRDVIMSPKEVAEWFKALRQAAVSGVSNLFDSENNFSEEDFKTITNVSKANFRDLYDYCENVVVYDKHRSIRKKDLAAFLIKLNQDLSDAFLKVFLSYSSRQAVSLAITCVRTTLSQRFVAENLGPGAITRDQFIEQHVTPFANELYNPDPNTRRVIVYIDGTYMKIHKSSNFRALRQSYCVHKGYHLLKPALVVASDGYILDVHGPYFSDFQNNDAAMLQHDLENEQRQDADRLITWLQPNDIVIVDRGYRNSIDFLNNLGLECKMPPFLERGQRQFTTEEANSARLITKTRWIVEARNGHLKSIFKFFRGDIQTPHVPHLGEFFRIACALINRYFPLIEMQGATAELAREMKRLADLENVVRARVEVEGLHLQRINNDRWTNLDELNLPEFPQIPLQELRDLTIGIYQLRLAPKYIHDRLQRENVEHFTFQVMMQEAGFLRARVYSRFTRTTKHQLWIAFQPRNRDDNENRDEEEETPIIGYYCTCKTGSRTVGCCAHVASVIWFLGYARYEENVKYPSNTLLHSILDAGERELPQV